MSASTTVRQAVPWLVLPLTLVTTGLASAPWLRAFPSGVLAAPLFGAAVLSVLVPLIALRFGVRPLWQTSLINIGVFVLYSLIVVLHDPTGFRGLSDGLVHGPAQILSFALPLVSPRTLLVAPVALCWLTGALAGECVARRWYSPLPYAGWLLAFGLSYAATVRATLASEHENRVYDTVLALALLLAMLLLRVIRMWVEQDDSASSTGADSVLPLRGLVVGVTVALLVGLIAAGASQSAAFTRRSAAPQRVPSVNKAQPLTPLSFVSGLRPANPKSTGQPVFSVQLQGNSPNYFALANVDYYDGDAWSFSRTFRPSGGVVPADPDPDLDVGGPSVQQDYRIDGPVLPSAPWMPYVYRPQQVTGTEVNVDATTGMVVPTSGLRDGETYEVRSKPPLTSFADLAPSALQGTAELPVDTEIPSELHLPLADVVDSLASEIGVPASPPIPYLQALMADFRSHYSLAGTMSTPSPAPTTSAAKPARSPSPAKPSSTPSASPAPPHSGGTSFADVEASVLGPARSATPEQYATLFALIARQLGVPARVATGFRVPLTGTVTSLAPGNHQITTAEAWTWVEIPVRGSGWVIADPTPSQVGTSTQPTSGTTPTTSSAPPSPNALVTQTKGGHAPAPNSAIPHHRAASHATQVLVAVMVVAALLLVVLLVLLLRKQLRVRRRRRVADPRLRLLNAWRESLDVLTESGLPELTTLTSTEVAEVTKDRFGPESAGVAADIGQAANAVVFSTSTRFGPEDADRAWQSQSTLRKLVRRQLPLGARLAAGVRYHHAPRRAPIVSPASWSAAARAAAEQTRRRRRYAGRRRAH